MNRRLLLILLFIILVVVIITASEAKPKSGPFVSKVFRIQNCKKPSKPYVRNPSILVGMELYNMTDRVLMKGNITVLVDEARSLSIRARYYRHEDGDWKIIHMLNGGGCRGMVVSTTLLALGIKYDSRRCSGSVGTYKFDRIEPNKVEHMWSSSREYGHFLWITEVLTPTATYFCFEYETMVTPLKSKSSRRREK